jgi:hypothetical protein
MPRGGKRPNAGRKKKADEQRLRDILSPYRDETIQTVVNIMRTGEKDSDKLAAAKLLMSYDWGLPTQKQEITMDNEPFILKLNGTK